MNILDHELMIRGSIFLAVFLLVAVWEVFWPKRALTQSKLVRWYSNFSIIGIDVIAVRLLLVTSPVSFAYLMEGKQEGLFNIVDLAFVIELFLGVVLLDMIIYFQHRVFHKVPIFWRFHRMHHTDLDYDVTTGSRFHPVEIVLSVLIKLFFIWVLGVSSLGVLIFEILLNATAMFNHANIHLAKKADRILRLFLVTPDLHRVHHSVIPKETNSNFGFCLVWWDKIFKSYIAEPQKGHIQMEIGLPQFRDKKYLHIWHLLLIPFKK